MLEIGTYFSTWNNYLCSKCNSLNWINFGDLENLVKEDPQAAICHNCETVFWLDEKYISDPLSYFNEENPKENIKEAIIKKGKQIILPA